MSAGLTERQPDAQFWPTNTSTGAGLFVSQSVSRGEFARLLASLANDHCAHSWKNFEVDGTQASLLAWENERRPTKLFFFYLHEGPSSRLVAAAAVADRLTRDFPYDGFCVLGRCYVMPEFRGRGFYKHIFRYRLENCYARFGSTLNAVHIGTADDRVLHVMKDHRVSGWSPLLRLGEERLRVADGIKRVGAYMLFRWPYLERLLAGLTGAERPRSVSLLREVLSRPEQNDGHDIGILINKALYDARQSCWGQRKDLSALDQLLLFCQTIPLEGLTSQRTFDAQR